MKNIIKGSLKINDEKEKKDNYKFVEILVGVSEGKIPSELDDSIVDMVLSRISFVTIDPSYEEYLATRFD